MGTFLLLQYYSIITKYYKSKINFKKILTLSKKDVIFILLYKRGQISGRKGSLESRYYTFLYSKFIPPSKFTTPPHYYYIVFVKRARLLSGFALFTLCDRGCDPRKKSLASWGHLSYHRINVSIQYRCQHLLLTL